MSTNPSSHVPATVSDPAPAGESSSGKITQAELEAHGTQKDMWILISGKGAARSPVCWPAPLVDQTEDAR
jgi:hypothetical protein